MDGYQAEKKRITVRTAMITNVAALVFIVLYMVHALSPIVLALLLLAVSILAVAWFIYDIVALNKRHGKY